MAVFEMARRISLNHDEVFFVTKRKFEVRLEDVCGTYGNNNLVLDADMKDALKSISSVEVSLSEIATAALQYFQTSASGKPWNYLDAVFLLTHEFGQAFVQASGKSSIGMGTPKTTGRHSEANKRTVEMFGYGLALTYISKALTVPTDLFDFITEVSFASAPTGTGTRLAQADFRLNLAMISPETMASLHPILVTFNKKGQRVYVEVKCYTGWKSFRSNGEDGKVLLANIAAKAAAHTDGCFIAVLVGLPKVSDNPRRNPIIMVADPNSPDPVPTNDRLVFVLKRYLFQSLRYGLWKTCQDIVDWLNELGALDAAEQAEVAPALSANSPDIQRLLLTREFDSQVFLGRIYVESLISLGHRGQRGLTQQEVKTAIRNKDAGQQYFGGINTALAKLLEQPHGKRVPEEVLAFGVGERFDTDLVNMSAFLMRPIDQIATYNRAALSELESALRHW